jgi:glutathione S-transferase
MTSVTLGYWKTRGLAQPSRLLLSYTNTPFTEVQYEFANKDQWHEGDKKNLGLEFPNLPYLIDGDFKLTETASIEKYIIRRAGDKDLLGRTAQDAGSVNNILGVIGDIFKEIRTLGFEPATAEAKAAAVEKLRPKFNYLRDFVAEREFALGYLTLADFILAERLYFVEAIFPEFKKEYRFLWRIRHNFEQLPGIRAYYSRADALVDPFAPPIFKIQPKYHKVKLGYWGIRGQGQVPRLLLSFAGVEFEDVLYTTREKWFEQDKVNLGLGFPNLPYLVDGEYDLSESAAIQRYIIEKWGKKEWLGKDAQDQARVETFLSVFNEAAGAVRGLFFNKDHETAKVGVIEKYFAKLEELSKSVGEKNFVLGYLTLADFIVTEESHYIERVYPEEYKKLPFLHRIRENFHNLPETVAYYAKPTAFKGRFFPQYAVFSVEQ